jgi:hypothetical protein
MTGAEGLPEGLQRLQTQLNLPLLVAAATLLLAHLQGRGTQRAVFASGSAEHFKAVFDMLRRAAGLQAPASALWHTSRFAQACAAPGYQAYCRAVFADGPMLVDVSGSGRALARLFACMELGAQAPAVFFCEFVADPVPPAPPTPQAPPAPVAAAGPVGAAAPSAMLGKAAPGASSPAADGVPALRPINLLSTRSFVAGEVLELLNDSGAGVVRGVLDDGWQRAPSGAGGALPARGAPAFEGEPARLVRAQAAFVARYIAALGSTLRPAVFDEVTGQAPQLLSALHDAATLVQGDIEALLHTLLPALRRHETQLASELLRAAG